MPKKLLPLYLNSSLSGKFLAQSIKSSTFPSGIETPEPSTSYFALLDLNGLCFSFSSIISSLISSLSNDIYKVYSISVLFEVNLPVFLMFGENTAKLFTFVLSFCFYKLLPRESYGISGRLISSICPEPFNGDSIFYKTVSFLLLLFTYGSTICY